MAKIEIDPHVLSKACETVANGLRDFGYPDVTAQDIKGFHEQWLKGRDDGDIIFKFAVKDFEGYPELFGRRECS